ncbi:MAG: DUF4405 domain-containing protein [Gammaproteobacteria bacterium]
MKQARLNLIIDIAAFVGFLALTTTGTLMRYLLPPGSGRFSTLWGLDRHQWGTLHFWIAVSFFAVLTLHLFLHWRWIANALTGGAREGSGLRAALGVVGLVTVTALAVSPLLTPVETDYGASGLPRPSGRQNEEFQIKGSMTLQEVEKTTGVPASYILDSLNLEQSTSKNERIGRLMNRYGIEKAQIREIIRKYRKEH